MNNFVIKGMMIPEKDLSFIAATFTFTIKIDYM